MINLLIEDCSMKYSIKRQETASNLSLALSSTAEVSLSFEILNQQLISLPMYVATSP